MTRFRFPLPRALILGNAAAVALLALALAPSEITDWEGILAQSARGAFSIMVAIVYGSSLVDLFCRQQPWHKPVPAHLVVMAIFLVFTAEAYSAVQAIMWRWEGKPEHWTHSGLWIIPPIVIAIAAGHLVMSPGSIDGKVPKRSMIIAGAGIGLTCLLFGIALGLTFGANGGS